MSHHGLEPSEQEALHEHTIGKIDAAPPAPAKPIKLSELDRLKLENVSLKLMNIGQQFEKLTEERARCSRQFDDLRKEYRERYGVDVATTRIDADGSFAGILPQYAK
jgi:hypothetical protein